MNNKDKILEQIIFDVQKGYISIHNYHDSKKFRIFIRELSIDIEKLSKYTFDGRFEKLLFDILNDATKNHVTYNDFIYLLKSKLEELSVPCIIIIPLNYIDDRELKNTIQLSNNIVLFKTDKPCIKYRLFREPIKYDTPLEKYFKEKAYKLLLRDHIETAKDRNFFNFPILTILVNNVDSRVINESGRIVETVYALIRMLDFEKELDECGWGYFFHSKLHPAGTYGVYYNKEGTKELPIDTEANGYGYSMRFKFQPILDVSTQNFLSSLYKFENILTKYISYCFMDKTKFSEKQLVKISKWQNTFQMFNNAYEFASTERYDSTLLLLLTILESLFVKNTGNKKENLILALEDFFQEKKVFDGNFIRINIEQAYKSRNKYVHEGVGVENEYVYSKPLNSYQGIYPGMKPFAHIGLYHYPSNIENIKNLFRIAIESIINYKEI
ncbi:MAG: hypothetical protein IKB70_06785 [Bacilli bacterium]|nr:hypothetical protein [Bacilli bacterium]